MTYHRPDAFDYHRQMADQNDGWHCWAASLAQRRLFYLARFGVDGIAPLKDRPQDLDYALDLINGSAYEPNGGSGKRSMEPSYSDLPYRVLPLKDSSLQCYENRCIAPVGSPYFEEQFSKIQDPYAKANYLEGRSVFFQPPDDYTAIVEGVPSERRNRESELTYSQISRFLNPADIGLLIPESNVAAHNEAVLKMIEKNIKKGRITLVVFHNGLTENHVSLISSIQNGPDGLDLQGYDSNNPTGVGGSDPLKDGLFKGSPSTTMFIRDEDDMDKIQNAEYDYYQHLCSQKN
ncbi:MAG: hypothetical protein P4M08_13825 [Oligoflexia bacterium]|nr:hypothetical protein [Oligoflexia bacterium]